MMEALKIAADLLINSSKLVQSWITRFIVVNGALFSAVGVIVSWDHVARFDTLSRYVLLTICTLGALASFLMIGVILRQNKWQGKYLDIVIALQKSLNVHVQPLREDVRGGGFVVTFVCLMGVGVIGAWVVLAAIIFQSAPFR